MEPQTPIATTPAPIQPAPSIEPPKLKNNSFLIILLSVLLLLATSLAFFFAIQTQRLAKQLAQYQTQPTPVASPQPSAEAGDPTADWKTYMNKGIGFSFQYPQILESSECKNGLHLFQKGSNLKSSEYCETPPFGKISVDYSTKPLDTGYSQSSDFRVKEENISIVGIQAKKQTVEKIAEAPGPDYSVYITFSNKNYYYMISLQDKMIENTFDQILSTFRFTD